MKEFPIIFNGEMVRAILDGRKTQTRRVVKRHPSDNGYGNGVWPYVKPGDRLWVRENYYRFGHLEPVPGVKTKSDRMRWRFVKDTQDLRYDVPAEYRKKRHHKDPATPAWHWQRARFMPRWASRATLEVVGVRVERLQDISDMDTLAEGCSASDMRHGDRLASVYARLWESINGPGSWAANPWVWVIEFRRIEA